MRGERQKALDGKLKVNHLRIKSETVINSGRQNEQIAGNDFDADPAVVFAAPHVKVPGSGRHVADLFVRVQVLRVEDLDLHVNRCVLSAN